MLRDYEREFRLSINLSRKEEKELTEQFSEALAKTMIQTCNRILDEITSSGSYSQGGHPILTIDYKQGPSLIHSDFRIPLPKYNRSLLLKIIKHFFMDVINLNESLSEDRIVL